MTEQTEIRNKHLTFDEIDEIIRRHQKKPPVQVVSIANDLGLEVYSAPHIGELSGVIKRDSSNPNKFAIYVNAEHHINRRRFTIAHEIAHFVLHRSLIGDGIVDDAMYRSGFSDKIEAQANRYAADILMPWHLLNPLIEDGEIDIGKLAEKFQVSENAMSIRLGIPT